MRIFSLLLVVLLMAACSGSDKQEQATNDSHETQDSEAAAEPAVDPHAGHAHAQEAVAVEVATRKVSCGCAIESIGTCGNYVEIDGNFAHIANSTDLGLGSMEWCGAEEEVTAETSGELKAGKFYALTLVVQTTD